MAAPRSGPVTVSFTQAITAASAPNLRVFGSQLRGRRPGSVAGGGSATLSFAPAQPFAAGERVSVTVPASLTNAAGTGASRQVYQFTAATGGAGRGFFLDTTEIASTNSRDQVLGDIDNDGDLDLLTSIGLFGMYSYLNNGQGVFTPHFNTVVGNTPSGAVLADVNQDGFLDLLAGDADNATVAIALNNGTGGFGISSFAGQLVNVGARPVSVATGDVDGDGDLDFASANFTGNTVSVGVNNGTGFFSGVSTVSVGTQPTTVQLADVDNDGDLDIVTSNAGSNSVSIRLNNGLGAFSGTTSVAVGNSPSDVALVDLDNDGDLDLLTTNAGGASVSVRLNSGGTFSGTTTLTLPPGSTPSGLSTGDVDGDGDSDVVVAQGAGGQVFTYLNTGSGSLAVQFGALALSPTRGAPTSLGVALADVDGDLDLDVVTNLTTSGRVILGRGGLAPPVLPPTLLSLLPAAGPVGTSVVLSGTNLASASSVLFNGTTASFVANADVQLTATVPAGATTGPVTVVTVGGTVVSTQVFTVTAGPVAPVLVTGVVPARHTESASATAPVQATFASPIASASASALRVMGSQRGARSGAVSGGGTTTLSLTPSPAFAPGEQVFVSLPATLTGTGGGSVQKQVTEFRAATSGTGEGLYGATGPVATMPASVANLRTADFDNDGDPDVVGIGPTGVFVRLNDGTGNFSSVLAGSLASSGWTAYSVVVADVDADGDQDLLVPESATNGTARIAVWFNSGQGQFRSGTPLGGVAAGEPMRTGDMDADGDLDLVYTDNYNSVIRIAFNNGAGQFTVGSTAVAFTIVYQFEISDLDNDGDLDLAVITDRQLISVLNNGQGVLTAQPAQVVDYSTYLRDLVVGDLTGDGIPDAAVLGFAQPCQLAIWPGLGNGQFGPHTLPDALGSDASRLLLVDVNADSKLDVLTLTNDANQPGVNVRLGTGRGSLQLPASYSLAAANQAIGSLLAADADGNGSLDLLVYNATLSTLTARLNQGRPAPTITALTPAQGAVGTRVVLTGTNLTSARLVRFGGVAATEVTVLSATQCAAIVPAGAVTGPVTVNTPGGTGTSPGSFTVTTPVTPVSFSPAPNAVSVPRNANISVTYSTTPPAGATGTPVVRTDLRLGRRTGTTSGTGTPTLTFDPTLDFAPGEHVQVSFPSGTGLTASQPRVLDFTAAAGGPGQGNMRGGGYSAFSFPGGEVFGDFDEDGAPDIIRQESQSSRLQIMFNNGQGQFGARTGFVPTSLVRAIRVADLNGDSHLDLLLAEFVAYRPNSREVNRLVWRAGTGTGSFGPAQPLHGLNGMAMDLAVGDLNGDGLPDLLALMQGADSVMVSLNAGNGAFQRRADAAATRGASVLRLADLDNNGTLDLLTTSRAYAYSSGGGTLVSRSLGTGSGDFVPLAPLQFALPVLALETGDVDGNGTVDLLVGTGNGLVAGGMLLLRGTGTGNFGASQNVFPRADTGLLRLGDFDADGDLDVVANQGGVFGSPQLLLNDGTGQFSPQPAYSTNVGGKELAVADFDMDGSLDLAMTGDSLVNQSTFTYKTGLFLYFNRPAAPVIQSFTPVSGPAGTVVTVSGTALSGATSVRVGGVAVPFIVVSATQLTLTTDANTATGPVSVTTPFGTSTTTAVFTVPVSTISSFTPGSGSQRQLVTLTGTYFGGTTAVRFNGLSAPGFVVVSGTQLTVPVPAGATTGLLSVTTPSGTATSATAFTVTRAPTTPILAPNRNASNVARTANVTLGFTQPITAAAASNIKIFGSMLRGLRPGTLTGTGTSTLTFDPTQDFSPGEEVSVSIPAAVQSVQGSSATKQVLQFRVATGGTGRGTFAGGQSLTGMGLPWGVRLGDLDNDGDLDLVVDTYSTYLYIALNNGTGTFTSAGQVAMGVNSSYPSLADLDGDGDLDLVTAYNYSLNNGAAAFGTPQLLTGSQGGYPAVGDIDSDGDLDIMVGLQGFLNNGNGTFVAGPVQPSGTTASLTRLADMDNDGDLDLVLAGSSGSNGNVLAVRLNDGNGIFAPAATILTFPQEPRELVVGDLDNDGDIDAASADYNIVDAGLSVYINDGNGRLAIGQRRLFATWNETATGLNIGDIDGDGDQDLLVSTRGITSVINEVRPYLNNGQASFTGVTAIVAANQVQGAALGDIDGDGDLDIAAASAYTTSVAIRFNGPTVPTATTSIRSGLELGISPNPAKQQFTLRIPAGLVTQSGTLTLVNSVGQVVYRQVLDAWPTDRELVVAVPYLSAGLYIVHLQSGSTTVTKRLELQ